MEKLAPKDVETKRGSWTAEKRGKLIISFVKETWKKLFLSAWRSRLRCLIPRKPPGTKEQIGAQSEQNIRG